jgi:hypothetical protein
MLNLVSGLVSGACMVVLWAVLKKPKPPQCSKGVSSCPYLHENDGWVHNFQGGEGHFVKREGKRL